MSDVLVIMSGAYCNAELQEEFGAVPSAYVPIGSKRIIDEQELLKRGPFVVAVPEDFLDPTREIFPVKSHLSIDHAFRDLAGHVDSKYRGQYERVHFLWGDTLVKELSSEPCVGVSETATKFDWTKRGSGVFNGYLCLDEKSIHEVNVRRADLRSLVARLPERFMANGDWLDFGHASTYWKSRTKFFKTRSFNDLFIMDRFLIKSAPQRRVDAELNWYRSLPPELAIYTPRTHAVTESSYAMQYLPMPSLAEIWVHGNRDDSWWKTCFLN